MMVWERESLTGDCCLKPKSIDIIDKGKIGGYDNTNNGLIINYSIYLQILIELTFQITQLIILFV